MPERQERPLRIGLIAPPWVAVPPPRYGGSELVIDQLARALQGKGHEVTLFATGDSACPVPIASVLDEAPGVHVGGAAVEMRQVIKAYAAFEGLDIVHDHTTIGPVFAAKSVQGPVVTTNHNPFIEPFTTIYREVHGRIPIIAISKHHAETAGSIVPDVVIHHGLNLDDYPSIEHVDDFALFLGRVSPDKGIVEAIRIARATGTPLVIAAKMTSANEVDYFRAEVEPLLGEQCKYLGEIDQATKLDLLSRARCLLNPINWDEPFGMAMLESLACSTPVIARRRGSAPEIIEDGRSGFLADTDEELAKALLSIDTIDRKACRARVAESFSASGMADAHLSFYRKVIASANGTPIVQTPPKE